MQDRPTAAELLEAARAFLEADVLDELTGRRRFHTRVLINVLGIVQREMEGEDAALRAELDALRSLTDVSADASDAETLRAAVWDGNVALSDEIRSGAYDDRLGEVVRMLRGVVEAKLAIANPDYASD